MQQLLNIYIAHFVLAKLYNSILCHIALESVQLNIVNLKTQGSNSMQLPGVAASIISNLKCICSCKAQPCANSNGAADVAIARGMRRIE